MLYRRLIPSLLLRGERLVKGVAFADHRDAGNPITTARIHNAQGADELTLLDIDASHAGRGPDLANIAVVARECFMPLTVGGGIRSIGDGSACMDAGADKLCVNSGALDDPSLITRLAEVFGRQAVVVGIDVVDAEGGWIVWHHRRKAPDRRTLSAWLTEAIDRGGGEVRLMHVEREGTRCGMDLPLCRWARNRVSVPVVLEGGAGNLEHLSEGLAAGADGVAVGTMLVFSDNNLVKVKRYLAGDGHHMRI